MNVLAGGSMPKLLLFVMLCTVLAFSSGCTSSQAVTRPQFQAMPPLRTGDAAQAKYVTILGPVTGTGPETFTIAARTGIEVTLGCIGKGPVWLTGPAGSFAAGCDDGGQWAGGRTQPTHLPPGRKVAMRVVAAASTRWELRIAGTQQGL